MRWRRRPVTTPSIGCIEPHKWYIASQCNASPASTMTRGGIKFLRRRTQGGRRCTAAGQSWPTTLAGVSAFAPSGYLTVSNIWASETPNARASRNRFLKDAFRRAVSTPPRYVRCIWANSARRCWDSPHSPSGCQRGGGPLTREASWASAYTLDAEIIAVLRCRRGHREAVQNPPYEGAGRGLRYDDSAVQRDGPAVRRVYLAGHRYHTRGPNRDCA